jgi:hypothetical protein
MFVTEQTSDSNSPARALAAEYVLPAGYCTSEQMDLLRLVIAEADNPSRKSPGNKPASEKGTNSCV